VRTVPRPTVSAPAVTLSRRAPLVTASLWAAALLVACGGDSAQTRDDAPPTQGNAAASGGAQDAPAAASAEKQELTILLTTDEHGWLEPFMDRAAGVRRGGVIEAYDTWSNKERLRADDVLLLSGGDMWTGPYETTVLEGKPMVKAFNHMGYAAAAVGNHEFDFGIRVLEQRSAEMQFPLLAANVREAASGQRPAWCKASIMVERSGMKIGVVGLTYEEANIVTDPKNLVGLEFLPYDEALRAEVPKLRAQGAEQIVALIHDRLAAATRLAPVLRELGITVVAVGHAHNSDSFVDTGGTPSDTSDDIVFCNAGAYLRSYCRIDVGYVGGKLNYRSVSVQQLERPITETVADPDATLAAIVDEARKASDKIGSEVLVKSVRPLKVDDNSLGQFITDSWLQALPYAQAAITNAGGIRQDLPKGKVRVRDIVSVLPFNNYLLVIEISGKQLKEVLNMPEAIQSGLRYTYRETPEGRALLELSDKEGNVITDEQRVKVIVNDFMYRGGDGFPFLKMDRNPEETALDWREPILRSLRDMKRNGQKLDYKADDRARLVE
jgi:5'-nucleotidase/UDP-sugar diphosphatase